MAPYGDPFDHDEPADMAGMPLCPVCPSGRPYHVEVRAGHGLECLNCGTIFQGTPGEMTHPRNQKRRVIAAQYARDEALAREAQGVE